MRPLCPTCGAPFRKGGECGRCGTDLRGLSAVILAAREAREETRRALLEGDGTEALLQVERSLGLHATEMGLRLRALALISSGRLKEGVRLAARLVEEERTNVGRDGAGRSA